MSLQTQIFQHFALVVDDSEDYRGYLKIVLTNFGLKVVEAGNGIEAIQQFKRFRPKITTLDLNMPQLNGFEAAQTILTMDDCAKIIMITGESRSEFINKAKKIGVIDYLTKPLKVDNLKILISNLRLHKNPESDCFPFTNRVLKPNALNRQIS